MEKYVRSFENANDIISDLRNKRYLLMFCKNRGTDKNLYKDLQPEKRVYTRVTNYPDEHGIPVRLEESVIREIYTSRQEKIIKNLKNIPQEYKRKPKGVYIRLSFKVIILILIKFFNRDMRKKFNKNEVRYGQKANFHKNTIKDLNSLLLANKKECRQHFKELLDWDIDELNDPINIRFQNLTYNLYLFKKYAHYVDKMFKTIKHYREKVTRLIGLEPFRSVKEFELSLIDKRQETEFDVPKIHDLETNRMINDEKRMLVRSPYFVSTPCPKVDLRFRAVRKKNKLSVEKSKILKLEYQKSDTPKSFNLSLAMGNRYECLTFMDHVTIEESEKELLTVCPLPMINIIKKTKRYETLDLREIMLFEEYTNRKVRTVALERIAYLFSIKDKDIINLNRILRGLVKKYYNPDHKRVEVICPFTGVKTYERISDIKDRNKSIMLDYRTEYQLETLRMNQTRKFYEDLKEQKRRLIEEETKSEKLTIEKFVSYYEKKYNDARDTDYIVILTKIDIEKRKRERELQDRILALSIEIDEDLKHYEITGERRRHLLR
jgi:hypothetical protein